LKEKLKLVKWNNAKNLSLRWHCIRRRQTLAQPKNLHNPAQAQNVVTKSGAKPDKFSGTESNRTEIQKGWGIYF
jgi:hypothetical protein